MKRDSLDELLCRADSQFPPPKGSRGLSDRLRARASQRARAHVAIGALATLAIAAVVSHSLRPRHIVAHDDKTKDLPAEVASWRAELAELDASAKTHEETAARLAVLQRQAEASDQVQAELLRPPDPLSYLEQARDRAARIMLMDAERVRTTPDGTKRAQQIYRRAEQLFPETEAVHDASRQSKQLGAQSPGDAIHA